MWKTKLKLGIRGKLLLPALITLLLLYAFSQWIWIPKQLDYLRNEIARHHKPVLQGLGLALVDPLLSEDLGQVHSTLESVRRSNPYWRTLEFRNAAGRLIYPVAASLTAIGQPQASQHKTPPDREITIFHTIEFSGNPLGQLLLQFDPTFELREKTRHLQLSTHIFVTILAITLILGFVLKDRLVVRPLLQLANAVRRMAHNNFHDPIQLRGQDEIAGLATEVENLRLRLGDTMAALEREKNTMQALFLNTTVNSNDETIRNSVMMAALALQAEMTLAIRIDPETCMSNTLAAWIDGKFVQNFAYQPDTDGPLSIKHQTICIGENAAEQHPHIPLLAERSAAACLGVTLYNREKKPIGQVLALFDQPLNDTARLLAILKIFAIRLQSVLKRIAIEKLAMEQAQHNRTILESVAEGIIVIDENGSITDFNPAAEHMFGYSANEMIGCNVKCLMPEPQSSQHDRYIARYLTTGEARIMNGTREVSGIRKNGEVFPLELNVTRMEGGNRPRFIGVMRDISERIQAREERQRLISILDTTPDFVGIATPDGYATYVNRAGQKMLGIEPEEAFGFDIRTTHPPRFAKHLENTVIPAVLHDGMWSGETVLLSRDGREIPVSQVLIAHYSSKDEIAYLSTIMRDMSERKSAEAALRKAHAQAQRYLDTAAVMLFSLDSDGNITMINRNACGITGYSEQELLQHNWFELCSPESDRAELADYFQEAMSGKAPLLGYLQLKLLTRAGEIRTLYLHTNILTDETGIIGALFSGDDITDSQRIIQERRRLQQQLTQAQKMEAIGQLTGGIAHDFNNLLAGVLGFAELAKEIAVEKQEELLAEYIAQILQAGERGRDLVAKMLAFSRQRVGEKPMPLLLAKNIPDMLKLLRPVIPSSVTIQTDLDMKAAPVLLDTVELQQMLMNLCINARDAMNGKPGTLTIRVCSVTLHDVPCNSCFAMISGNFTELSICDTGSGMDDDTAQRLFEPFFTTKDVGKGTGMGLSMVHGIVHERGGHIVVETGVGRGTCFRLLFPEHTG